MIGFGYDVHKLAEGESLVLGGVVLESRLGTVAHSDGDVLLHAVMDALLGALALGDIGLHFPDTKEEWRGADSIDMLERVMHILHKEEAHVVNIDSTVVLEAPRLRPHIEAMRERIRETVLGVPSPSESSGLRLPLTFAANRSGSSIHSR